MEGRPDLFGPGDGLLDRLDRWAADARADHAVAARAREGFLRRTAAEDATFAGVLVDLAERGGPVLVALAGGRRHRGVVRAVGADFVGLRTAQGGDVLAALAGVVSVRADGRDDPVAGDRAVEVAAGLAEVLAVLAEDRPRVLVVAGGDPDGLAGELRSVGRDVLVLRLDGADRPTAYVRIANLVEVSLA